MVTGWLTIFFVIRIKFYKSSIKVCLPPPLNSCSVESLTQQCSNNTPGKQRGTWFLILNYTLSI